MIVISRRMWYDDLEGVMKMSVCAGCAYRKENPGDCHVTCMADLGSTGGAPKLTSWNGCGMFPLNYDEGIVLSCPSRSETKDHPRKDDSLLSLMGILASVGRI